MLKKRIFVINVLKYVSLILFLALLIIIEINTYNKSNPVILNIILINSIMNSIHQ